MKISQMSVLFLVILLCASCLTTDKNKNNSNKNIKTYSADLNNDNLPETIKIDNRFFSDGNTIVEITKGKKNKKTPDKKCTFIIPGSFRKIEFVDLNDDGFKQMAIYYDTKDGYSNLAIYKLRDDKVTKIFFASSNCDVEGDFSSLLARVKVGKNKEGNSECSGDTDVWVYTGEKFIKEK